MADGVLRRQARHATLFSAAFNYSGATYNGKTLLEVLQTNGGPPDDVGRHVVAALLNAAKGWTAAPSVATVKAIWKEYANTGFFSPTAGVQWDHQQIVNYLTSTMPL